jgi:hypothetical protein
MAWIFDARDLGEYDPLFLVVGRAVHLAAEFEHKCRCVLSILRAVDRMTETDDLDATLEFARAVEKQLLHPMLQEVGTHGLGDAEDAVLLDRARRARNFIAHESAKLSVHSPRELVGRLREEVRALAAGDNVASRWLYEISEKRLAPQEIQRTYIDRVEAWVFLGIVPA